MGHNDGAIRVNIDKLDPFDVFGFFDDFIRMRFVCDRYYVSDLARDESLLIVAQAIAKCLIADENRKSQVQQYISHWTPDAIKYINA